MENQLTSLEKRIDELLASVDSLPADEAGGSQETSTKTQSHEEQHTSTQSAEPSADSKDTNASKRPE